MTTAAPHVMLLPFDPATALFFAALQRQQNQQNNTKGVVVEEAEKEESASESDNNDEQIPEQTEMEVPPELQLPLIDRMRQVNEIGHIEEARLEKREQYSRRMNQTHRHKNAPPVITNDNIMEIDWSRAEAAMNLRSQSATSGLSEKSTGRHVLQQVTLPVPTIREQTKTENPVSINTTVKEESIVEKKEPENIKRKATLCEIDDVDDGPTPPAVKKIAEVVKSPENKNNTITGQEADAKKQEQSHNMAVDEEEEEEKSEEEDKEEHVDEKVSRYQKELVRRAIKIIQLEAQVTSYRDLLQRANILCEHGEAMDVESEDEIDDDEQDEKEDWSIPIWLVLLSWCVGGFLVCGAFCILLLFYFHTPEGILSLTDYFLKPQHHFYFAIIASACSSLIVAFGTRNPYFLLVSLYKCLKTLTYFLFSACCVTVLWAILSSRFFVNSSSSRYSTSLHS
jgi:hypothetical protein